MLPGFLRALWGDLSKEEVKKFGLLSCVITLILGNYWMLRVLKNPIFNDLVGLHYQPKAKIASIFIVAFIVLIYSKLVDIFDKKTLFDIICIFYALIFGIICVGTKYPEYFSLEVSSALYPLFAWIPGKLIGWITYFAFESSSLLIILFWAFVASITKPESAKKGYAMIVTCTQIGTISGPAIVTNYAAKIGSPFLVGLGAFLVLLVPLLIRIYMWAVPKEEDAVVGDNGTKKEKMKPKTGFLEGLNLIFTRPYVMGIFVVSTIYEIISTILEFQMTMIAKEIFPSRDVLAAFMGKYGMSINSLAMLFALLGTSFFMRKFGLRFCLLAYPIAIGIVLITIFTANYLGATHVQLMWVLFGSMVAVKGFSYALNNPTKEVMYIPTTKDIKYKAKGWIESFGGRLSKGTGAIVTNHFAHNLSGLLIFGTLISLGVLGFWLVVANLLGKKFNELQTQNKTIE